MKHLLLLALSFMASGSMAAAQAPAEGLTLFNPNFSKATLLVDANGVLVHSWATPQYAGLSAYLEPDGTLLRSKLVPGPINIGGVGGGVQRIAFDGTVTWDLTVSNAQAIQHHEVIGLPNGNVLMIVWERLGAADVIAAGRNPGSVSGPNFLPDAIVEYQPTGPTTGVEVWRWRAVDHLVQDFDNTKPNFGVVADHPERINVNFPTTLKGNGDWMHSNSLDYSPSLDQIVLSVPEHNEIWIIDHSTTTAQAAGSTGGNSGKGGDLLYRWGNPQAYGAGGPADQQLFFQHGSMFIEPGSPGAGNILLFNNRIPGPPQHSEVWELVNQADGAGNYPLAPGASHGPAGPTWTYVAPNPGDLTSNIISSAQRMANGNTLICSGAQGWLFEVTDAGAKVWEHFNTVTDTGTTYVFKARRYQRYLWSSSQEVSASAGGTIDLNLISGSNHAGEVYFVLGSFSGTTPGLPIDGHVLPLVTADPYFNLMVSEYNVGAFQQTLGVLDGLGKGSASITVPPGIAIPLVGLEVNHAFATLDPVTFEVTMTSGAEPLVVVP